ncbi:PHP domain-containing protein [Alistipes sp. OttesenSCG-928-B03]|nr:PHP domain-containing protein [Alistipes sp. OttesenSCG-928-B03]
MNEELRQWLDANRISYHLIDKEVFEIEDFGKVFIADLSGLDSIFRGDKENLRFNLMENEQILMDEGIFYVAFPFGQNWFYYDLREEFRFRTLKYLGKRQKPEHDLPFVNLGVHTPYELLNASGDLAVWVQKAKYFGHTALGICDLNTMGATLNFQKECAKAGIKHVFGYSFTLENEGEDVDMKMYCQTQQGLDNMLRLQKAVMVDSPEHKIGVSALLKLAQGNILIFGKLSSFWMHRNQHIVDLMEDHFEKVYYQVDLSEYKAERFDIEVLEAAKHFFDNYYLPLQDTFIIEPVLICDNYYPDNDDARSKVVLNKVATGAAHRQSEEQYFKDTDEHYAVLRPLFGPVWDFDRLFERLCRNTVEIARNASAHYEFGKMYMPRYLMLPSEIEKYGGRRQMLRSLLEEGLRQKISSVDHDRYRKRMEEELYIIESTNNVDYFLIQWDMINEAHKRGIVTGVGRGSAGGSLVSYLLGIISIDPIQYDLLFSRFLVPERCGLNWRDEMSLICGELELAKGKKYAQVWLNGKCYRFDKDAQFRILRDGEEMTLYADQVLPGDDVLIDNRDLIWTFGNV